MNLAALAAALALAGAKPPPAANCSGAPPRPDCQCLCQISSARPGGLIYVCAEKRWFCPAKAPKPHRKAVRRRRK